MGPKNNIDKLIKKLDLKASTDLDNKIHRQIDKALARPKKTQPVQQPNIWRILMNSKTTKFAAAAAVICIITLALTFFEKSTTPAWAIGQSVKMLKNIETITLSGKSNHIAPVGDFSLMLKRGAGNWDSLIARGESDDLIFIVNDNMWYDYTLGCGEIYAHSVEDLSSFGTKVWNEIIKNAPWIIPISPTMFKAAKLLSDDWQETYKLDNQTGRDCVFVTGGYKALSASFLIVFDLESKLIVRAKYWLNPHRKGEPGLEIERISYDEEIPDELFDPEKLAKVISKEEREKRYALFHQANSLAGKKQYRESIEIFLQLYETYPQFKLTPVALQYIGECYRMLGQHEKAIEFFEKVLREYSAPKEVIADVYRLLGSSYMSVDKNTKALENYEKGLEFITQWDSEGWRHYRETYRKEVEENIEKLKKKNK